MQLRQVGPPVDRPNVDFGDVDGSVAKNRQCNFGQSALFKPPAVSHRLVLSDRANWHCDWRAGCAFQSLRSCGADEVTQNASFESAVLPQLRHLPPREREVAEIIYSQGSMTAKDLEDRLPRSLSNGAILAMLGRLCAKGILIREKVEGSHRPTDQRTLFAYAPAISSEELRKAVLRDVAKNYFGGSLVQVAQTSMQVLNDESPIGDLRWRA